VTPLRKDQLKNLLQSRILRSTRLTKLGNIPDGAASLKGSALEIPVDDAANFGSGAFLSRSYADASGSRDYKLYVPGNLRSAPLPLVVMLHGCTQSADDFAVGTGMNAIAQTHGVLVAYPIQSTSANRSKCWNWFERRDQQRGRGEPALVVGMIEQIARCYAVDHHRIYVAGLSAGGAAAAVLAANYPDVFAAVGIHSGLACGAAHDLPSAFAAMRGAVGETITHQSRTPTIVFVGDRDTTVHPANGARIIAATSASEFAATSESGRVPGGRAYARTTYRDSAARVVHELWTVHGTGHAWSGGNTAGSYTDPTGPDASLAMMQFFLTHQQQEAAA